MLLSLCLLGSCKCGWKADESSGAHGLAAIPALADRQPWLESVDCWFEASDRTPHHHCYQMHVPENHRQPGGRWITFPVARFTADGRQKADQKASVPVTDHDSRPPVLHLGGGGPGAAMLSSTNVDIDAILDTYAPLALDRQRDFIVIDPRGSGAARPHLNCDEFQTAFPHIITIPDNRLQLEQTNAVSARCYQRLAATGIDLGQYNSGNVARDIEALRQALEISRWHLYGISYGTRYALTLIRDFPASVLSAVLDSPVFPGVNYGERSAQDLSQAFTNVFQRCKATLDCHSVYPDIEAMFWSLVEKLNSKPLSLTVINPLNGAALPYVLSGDVLLSIAFTNLYDHRFIDALPDLIYSLNKGDAEPLEPYTERWVIFMLDDSFSDGSYNSHLCADEFPYIDYDALKRTYETTPPVLADLLLRTHAENSRFCHDIWPVTPSGDPYVTTAIRTGIPLLLLQGALDPAVNAAHITTQLQNFPHAAWTIFAEAAHDIVSSSPCAADSAGRFFDSATAYNNATAYGNVPACK